MALGSFNLSQLVELGLRKPDEDCTTLYLLTVAEVAYCRKLFTIGVLYRLELSVWQWRDHFGGVLRNIRTLWRRVWITQTTFPLDDIKGRHGH